MMALDEQTKTDVRDKMARAAFEKFRASGSTNRWDHVDAAFYLGYVVDTMVDGSPDDEDGRYTWTPDKGPLARALDEIPDAHPVEVWIPAGGPLVGKKFGREIRVQLPTGLLWVGATSGVSKARWTTVPAWAVPNPPLAVCMPEDATPYTRTLWVWTGKGYQCRLGQDPDVFTPAQLQNEFGVVPEIVLDADGSPVAGPCPDCESTGKNCEKHQ